MQLHVTRYLAFTYTFQYCTIWCWQKTLTILISIMSFTDHRYVMWPDQNNRNLLPKCFLKPDKADSNYHRTPVTLQWRHNGRDGVSSHQPHDCLLNRLFRHKWKKTSKLRVTGLCAGNSPVTGEFPTQKAGNAENVSIWWRHHEFNAIQNEWLRKSCDSLQWCVFPGAEDDRELPQIIWFGWQTVLITLIDG